MRASVIRKTSRLFVLAIALLLALPQPGGVVRAAVGHGELVHCRTGAFSTEEDFMSRGPRPPDGSLWISDGDLLSVDGNVCARNADLTSVFSATGAPLPDLGLDAVDILDFEQYQVAFSTELDAPNSMFGAGDLLITNGAIIPNVALVTPFGVNYDVGLDEVKFIGTQQSILTFFEFARDKPPAFWLNPPTTLQTTLKRYSIDLWFSTEGTALTPNNTFIFLDGDLLSAATGTIIVSQAALLPASVPAGLPTRGVDFGLDAFALPRNGDTKSILFSTEIVYNPDPPAPLTFTDGDVLRFGDGVAARNWDLIKNFNPAARDLGLDALYISIDAPPPSDPNIQTLCGDRPAVDFDGGMVAIGGTGSGLYRANLATLPPGDPPRQPCGEYVPVDGYLPSSGITRFRVSYRPAGDPAPPVNTAAGVRTTWTLYAWHGWPINACLPTGSLSTDANGWMDAAQYLAAKDGTLTGCANPGLRLAVWDTNNHEGFGPPNKDGHYVLWLEWEDAGGLHREPVEHHVQLDNTLPEIAPYPAGLQLRLLDGTTTVAACGQAPSGAGQFQVWGQFDDAYYWNFRLSVRGGSPPATAYWGPHNYWDTNDGTVGIKNTDDTGTIPDSSTVYLRQIDLTPTFGHQACCYLLDMWVQDAAIRHTFNHRTANDSSGSSAYQAYSFITFAAAP